MIPRKVRDEMSLDQLAERELRPQCFPQGADEQFISQMTRVGCWDTLSVQPDVSVSSQDLNEAMSMVELQQELGLQAVDSQREVFLLAASIAPAGTSFENPGTVHIWKLLLELLS